VKIRTASGGVIDLAEVRTYIDNVRQLAKKARETYIVDVNTFEPTEGMMTVQEAAQAAQRDFIGVATHHIEPILDALESALSLPEDENCLTMYDVRKAAGVVEDEP